MRISADGVETHEKRPHTVRPRYRVAFSRYLRRRPARRYELLLLRRGQKDNANRGWRSAQFVPLDRQCEAVYQTGDFDRIAKATSVDRARVESKATDLEAAARWYLLDKAGPVNSSPVRLRKKIEQIEKSARRLLHHLGCREDAPDGQIDPDALAYFVWSPDLEAGKAQAADASARIKRLVEIVSATRAAKEIEERAERGETLAKRIGAFSAPRGYSSDRAKNDWIAAMLPIYKEITGEEAVTQMADLGSHRAEAAESFIHFLSAAGTPLAIVMEPSAWSRRVRTVSIPQNQEK